MAPATFTFRFQKLLDVKEHQEKALAIDLAQVDRALLVQRDARRRWQLTRRALLDELGRARRDADLLYAGHCAGYLRHVRSRLKQCDAAIAGLGDERARVCGELELVMRSRKLLEGYRDRLRRQFLAEQEKAEEKILDLHRTRSFIQAESGR